MKTKFMKSVMGIMLGLLTAISGVLSIYSLAPITRVHAINESELNDYDTINYMEQLRYGYNVTGGFALHESDSKPASAILAPLENGLYKYIKKDATAIETKAGNAIGYSTEEIANSAGEIISGGIDGKISAVNLNIAGGFNRETTITEVTSERYELYYQKVQRLSYMVEGYIDLRNYLDEHFKEDLYAVNTPQDAEILMQTYGTHLFTGRYFGGIVQISNYIKANSYSVDLSKVTKLETKIGASFNAYGEGNASIDFEGSEAVKEDKNYGVSNYRALLYGGISVPALTMNQLFTYNPSAVGNGDYNYGRWINVLNQNEGLRTIGIPASAKNIPLWELLPDTSQYAKQRGSLIKAYAKLCGDKYDQYLKQYPSPSRRVSVSNDDIGVMESFPGYNLCYKNVNKFFKFEDNSVNPVYRNSTVQLRYKDTAPIGNKEWQFTTIDAYEYVQNFNPKTGSFTVKDSAPIGQLIEIGLYSNGTKVEDSFKSFKITETNFSGGTGEENNPYIIASVDDFKTIIANQNLWNKHFKLINNLDLQKGEISGIGTEAAPFTGTFDGNYCTVSNFKIVEGNAKNGSIGLFNYLNGGTVKNLFINNAVIGFDQNAGQSSTFATQIKYAGALCGKVENGTIKNCKAENISVAVGYKPDDTANIFVGGLIGYAVGNTTKIEKCFVNNVTVDGELNKGSERQNVKVIAGAFIGVVEKATLTDCAVTNVRKVRAYTLGKDVTSSAAGGIGEAKSGSKIERCLVGTVDSLIADGDRDWLMNKKTYSTKIDIASLEDGVTITDAFAIKNSSYELQKFSGKDSISVDNCSLSRETWYDKDNFPALIEQSGDFYLRITPASYIQDFYYGEEFNIGGVEVKACFNIGNKEFDVDTFTYETDYSNYKYTGQSTIAISSLGKIVRYKVNYRKLEVKGIILEANKDKFFASEEINGEDFSIYYLLENGETILASDPKNKAYVNYPSCEISIETEKYVLGDNKIVAKCSHCDFSAETVVKAEQKEVTGIKITKEPNNEKPYYEGDKVDLTGLEVSVTYNDGKPPVIIDNTHADLEVIGNTICVGENEIIIAFGSYKTDSFTVIGEAKEKPVYLVVFDFDNGSSVLAKEYHYGEAIEIPANPEKASDSVYTYTFSGWDKQISSACLGNATYTATYAKTYIDYIITFKNDKGGVISTKTYHYGDEVEVPTNPEKENNNTFTYEFSGWDKPVTDTCVGNATYTATFKQTYIDYVITFKDENGVNISSKVYHYGDTIEEPTTPTKASDNTYTYTFSGWNKEVSPICNGHATYTATFKQTYIDYAVTFKNEDGSVISTKTYHYGDVIAVPANPEKASDNIYTYTFSGWGKYVSDVCAGNETYTATYAKTYINYVVTFKNEDGAVVSTKNYHYGDAVEIPANPEKASDNIYTYTFSGWDKQVSDTCVGNATYTATYSKAYINYVVTFKNENGVNISSKTYHYGDAVEIPANPEKANDNTYTYEFNGWNKEVSDTCIGHATYTATYSKAYINYVVTFKNENGVNISSKTYHYGDVVEIPANPAKASDNTYTYEFSGWDKVVSDTCVGNATYTATYAKAYINYVVTFKNEDGAVVSTNNYHYGDVVEIPANPTKTSDNTYTYEFGGWDKVVSDTCVGNATYTATYSKAYINYVVTFCDENGSVISTKPYHYGDEVEIPANPTKERDNEYIYIFNGWNNPVNNFCKGNATYTATYKAIEANSSAISSTESSSQVVDMPKEENTPWWLIVLASIGGIAVIVVIIKKFKK